MLYPFAGEQEEARGVSLQSRTVDNGDIPSANGSCVHGVNAKP